METKKLAIAYQDAYERIGRKGGRPVEQATELRNESNGKVVGYAWSPDGFGAYYYDTLDELLEQHG
jgi:hypothetical protein